MYLFAAVLEQSQVARIVYNDFKHYTPWEGTRRFPGKLLPVTNDFRLRLLQDLLRSQVCGNLSEGRNP